MNIELEEVVVQDVSDDALEQAAGGPLGGVTRDQGPQPGAHLESSITHSSRIPRC